MNLLFSEVDTRICSKCKIKKSLSEFHKRAEAKQGVQSWCKECKSTRKIKRSKRKGYKICTRCSIEKLVSQFGNNKIQYDGKHSWCRKCLISTKREYRKKYPDRDKKGKSERMAKRRARLANVISGNIPSKEYLLNKQNGMCAYCKCKGKNVVWHLDHIIPISKGGSNTINNVQILCMSCNLKKNDKDPIRFAQENGRLL